MLSVIVVGNNFRDPEKRMVSLVLAFIWLTWATINSIIVYSFSETMYPYGVVVHSLVGGCGLCGVLHLIYGLGSDNNNTGSNQKRN